ncbi:MAG: endonuclease [Paludibacteraceae bacterium]|nr:endonuclease [Paludibacteraceae bacterium]
MRKHTLALLLLASASLWAAPKDPAYYAGVDGKAGATLFNALKTRLNTGFVQLSYNALLTAYEVTDYTADGHVWDMYGGCNFLPSQKCGNYSSECDCYNREHSLPKSWFGGSTSGPGANLFHVVPTDGKVNGMRSNNAFGEVGSATYTYNGSKLGNNTLGAYSGKVFEPIDEYKGDFARGYMAMVLQYAGSKAFTSGNGAAIFNTDFTSGGNYGLTEYGVLLLMKWHRQDPVSQKEIDRNNGIEAMQGNRNPFVDYPCLAEYLWGTQKDKQVDLSALQATFADNYQDGDGCVVSNDPLLTAPVAGSVVNIGSANLGQRVVSTVRVTGINLTQPLTVSVSRAAGAAFASSAAVITPAEAMSGYQLEVSYTPEQTGTHEAVLTLSSTEVGQRVITLSGQCMPMLVEPAQQTLYIEADALRQAVRQEVNVRGTNLSSGVQISLDASSDWQLDKAELTAEQTNQGTPVVLTFSPSRLGEQQAVLTIESKDAAFEPRRLTVVGQCFFHALPAADITAHGFKAGWMDVGASRYVLDVYTYEGTQSEPVRTIMDDINGSTRAGSMTAGYTAFETYENQQAIRLGSSSKVGTLSYPITDLTGVDAIVVSACYYRNDAGARLIVSVDGQKLAAIDLTAQWTDYVVDIPEALRTNTASLSLSNEAAKLRVYLNSISTEVKGEQQVRTSVSGFPSEVGSATHFDVTGLAPSTTYYYTVRIDGEAQETDEIEVTTLQASSAVQTAAADGLRYAVHDGLLSLQGLRVGQQVRVCLLNGQRLHQLTAGTSELTIRLPHAGVYVLTVDHAAYKIVI